MANVDGLYAGWLADDTSGYVYKNGRYYIITVKAMSLTF